MLYGHNGPMQRRHTVLAVLAIAAIAVVAVVARSGEPAPKGERRKARADRVAADLAQPVRTHRWAVGEHELVLVEAPASNGFTVVRKQCFVWRDAQFRTASLSCTSETDELEPPPER